MPAAKGSARTPLGPKYIIGGGGGGGGGWVRSVK